MSEKQKKASDPNENNQATLAQSLNRRAGRSTEWQRSMDRWIGIPLVWILGVFRILVEPQRVQPKDVRSIALLKATAIGDTVILSATLAELQLHFPEASFTWFVGKSNFAAAELVLAGLFRDKRWTLVELKMTSPWQALREIRKKKFDIWLDFGTWSRLEAIYSFLSNSGWKVGFKSENQFRHFAYDRWQSHSCFEHECNNYLRLLQSLGLPVSSGRPKLPLCLESNVASANLILFHLKAGGSQAQAKEWPLDRWQKLAELVLKQGYQLGLTGGPTDEEALRAFAGSVGSSKVVVFAGQSLPETVKLLQKSKVLVSIDTGLLHLASALDIPLVGLHGPTHSERWGALNPRASSVNACSLKEAPLRFGFEKTPYDLMKKISVEDVWALILSKITNS